MQDFIALMQDFIAHWRDFFLPIGNKISLTGIGLHTRNPLFSLQKSKHANEKLKIKRIFATESYYYHIINNTIAS